MAWTEYRKTAHVEAVLIQDFDDIPHEAGNLCIGLDLLDPPKVDVNTAEEWVRTPLPFYLCREPGATDHAWPVQPEHFEAWYEEVES